MFLTKEIIEKDVQRLNKKSSSNVRLFGYISDRSGRKSSAFQSRIIDKAINGKPSIIIRNKTNRPITDKWFSDYMQEYINENNYYTYSEKIEEFKGAMTITYLCTNPDSPEDNTHILYYGLYLSVQDMYKSNFYSGWDNVEDFIFEEAIPSERLVQDERHIISNSMKQMFDLLSIVSTVSRGRAVNCFLLGNDIKYNLLNPLTISFDLLERIEINKRIIDTCVINDIKYDFLFLYFDFPGSVNHWLIDDDKKIDSTIPVDNLPFKNYGFITKFKKYLIYTYNSKQYISDKQFESKNKINSKKELLHSLGYDDYLYSPDIQIQILLNHGTEEDKAEIYRYIDKFGRFRVPKVDDSVYYFDLEKISKMKIHEIDSMPNSEVFKGLLIEFFKFKTIYSNYKIKTVLNELYYELELYKKIC